MSRYRDPDAHEARMIAAQRADASRYNPGPDRPYDYSRERIDAENACRYGTRRISGVPVDERDVPDRGDA